MKYRIRITTFENGRKEFRPYFKGRWFWLGISWKGEAGAGIDADVGDSRDKALAVIDKHFSGNTKVQTIEFEYITK